MAGAPGMTLPLKHAGQGAGEAVRADDDGCMRAVQDGVLEALATLFERHHRALFNYFLRLGSGGRATAEDLTQEVFVRLLKYRASYRPGTRFTTWMYAVARNVRLDHIHKRRGEVAWDEAYTPRFAPTDTAENGQHRMLLERALARLPEDKREIIVLSRFQELSFDEIGALLNCAPGAARVRLHRALRALSRQFQAEAGTPSTLENPS